MKTGKCPKCKQQNIYATTAERQVTEVADGVTHCMDLGVILYGCADCGFYESYFKDPLLVEEDDCFWYRVSRPVDGPFR